jgi:hypothetical protein
MIAVKTFDFRNLFMKDMAKLKRIIVIGASVGGIPDQDGYQRPAR